MTTTWMRSALGLALALIAAGIAALLLHLPVPSTIDGPPSLAGLVSYLKPVVIFGWPAAVAAILVAPRLSLLSSLLYWLVAGLAIGAAGLLFLKKGELAAFHDASSLFDLAKFGVTGALGGLVYWLFAGRSIAVSDAAKGSAFGLGNLALASLIGLLPPLLLSSAPDDLLKTAKTEVQSPAPVPAPPAPVVAPAAVQPSAPPAAVSAPEKKPADDQKRVADDAAKRKAAEDKHLAEEAARKKAEEEKRLAEDAARKKAEEEKRLADEAAKRKAAEEKRLAEDAAKKKAEEEKRLAEEAAKRKAAEEKRLAEDAAKSRSDDQSRRTEAVKSAVQTACADDLKLLLSSKLIKFGLNSAALDSDAAGFVVRLAEKLKSCTDFKLIVGGYSDTSGSSARNLEVSTARAEAVKAALVAGGVGAERVTARGYGSSLPQAGGNEARAETPGRKAVIAVFDTATPAAAPVLGATEPTASPAAPPCSADAGKLLLSETLYFGSGSLAVKGDQRRLLKKLAQFAKRCDNVRVTITGHTDNVGSAAVNEELAQERADRVANFLARLGAPKVRIVTNGLGSARPVDTNDTPAGRARNRRVVIGFEPA